MLFSYPNSAEIITLNVKEVKDIIFKSKRNEIPDDLNAFNQKIEQEHTKIIYVKRKEYYGNLGFYPRCDFSRVLLDLISFKRKCFTEQEILRLMDSPLNFYVELHLRCIYHQSLINEKR